MSIFKKQFLLLVFSLLSFIVFNCSSQNGYYIDNYDKTYSSNGVEKISAKCKSGDIKIEKWDKEDIKIEITKRSYFNDCLDKVKVDVNEGKTFTVEAKYDNICLESNVYIKFKIYIPENIEIKVSTKEGDVDINNVSFVDEISTENGDIKADIIGMKCDVKITTQNGDIKVKIKEDIYKRIKPNTENGDIDIKDISKKGLGDYDIELSSKNGDINISGK